MCCFGFLVAKFLQFKKTKKKTARFTLLGSIIVAKNVKES
jgi:hypothetical protein